MSGATGRSTLVTICDAQNLGDDISMLEVTLIICADRLNQGPPSNPEVSFCPRVRTGFGNARATSAIHDAAASSAVSLLENGGIGG